MRLSHFDYYAPTTVADAISLLQSKPDAHVMAGGTDLLIKMRHAGLKLKTIISLKSISGLNTIAFDETKGLTIGATALLADVAIHPDILKYYPTVAQAARGTANVQVRNMGTVIGNLCNASPAADNAPTLLAMGAEVHIQGPSGKRTVPLDQFFKGPGMTALEPAEIVTAVHVPRLTPHSGTAYISLSARGQLDCSAVGVATMVTLKEKVCEDTRIFVGACGPTPIRVPKAETIVRGKELTDDLIDQAGVQASAEATPITDVRASADYREKMVAVLTRRVLSQARKRASE
ncbi:FAD binding domain-containing protein [Desulfonema magnum]|uniref:Dehydrogenase domain-containing protein n=1 Tax=Desulfonema magnum TaxID=45655 RepID=A0A975BL53_9BACT|nr:FAD binding domain-containing protein [Desulfonema magnum]QTA87123.1 Dehydrogenase domain-containing protein [Desulfonema magnum]